MSDETFDQELNALRETLPEIVEGASSSKSVRAISYTPDLGRRIVDSYAQGISLHTISRKGEMPHYTTLLRWAKDHPELSKMLRSVRVARAIHFEDAAIEAAEAATGKDADRIRVDTYIWAAEVNDPTTYGKKVTHAGDSSNPVVLQVVTGFGPPNVWQTPPKLREDGTIDKGATQEVKSEVSDADGRSDHDGGSPPDSGRSEDFEPAGLPDVASGGSAGQFDGSEALPAVEGHPTPDGSPEGASVRGVEL